MFLPVILLERYGWLGFAVFAIPNVVGCAGFGYVIRNRAASESMVRTHGPAMAWFSAATILFHIFFAGFAARFFLDASLGAAVFIALVAYALMFAISYAPRTTWLPMAAVAYGISIIAFLKLGVQPFKDYSWHATIGPGAAVWLIPVTLLGFLLCPYLDLTFHRARQLAPSRHAFGVFGITFAVMIVLTCAYAPFAPDLLPAIVLIHIAVQLLFTAAAHAREIRECDSMQPHSRLGLLAVPLLGVLIVLVLAGGGDVYAFGKDVYLRFIVIYGLFAPAYVLLIMLARRLQSPTRSALVTATALTLLVSPCYEFGFFHGATWLLAIPPVVLTAAAIGLRIMAPPATTQTLAQAD